MDNFTFTAKGCGETEEIKNEAGTGYCVMLAVKKQKQVSPSSHHTAATDPVHTTYTQANGHVHIFLMRSERQTKFTFGNVSSRGG
jgi:hypothetical protein